MEEEVSTGRRVVTLTLCFIECLLFAGNLSSWSILVYVLKQDGIFAFECPQNHHAENSSTANPKSHDITSNTMTPGWMDTTGLNVGSNSTAMWVDQSTELYRGEVVCPGQDAHLSLAFTMGLVADGILSIPLGWLQDRYGLRVTRVVASIFAISAYLFLGLAAPGEMSWLVYPGCICMALSCHIIIMTNCHICGLAGRHASKLVSLYNGGVNAGLSFLVVKLAAEAGVSRLHSLSFLTGTWGLVLFTTFCLLPSRHVTNTYSTNKEKELQGDGSRDTNNSTVKTQGHNDAIKLGLSSSKDVQLLSVTSLMEVNRGKPNLAYSHDTNHFMQIYGNNCRTDGGYNNNENTIYGNCGKSDSKNEPEYSNKESITERTNSTERSLLRSSLLSATYLFYLYWFSLLFLRISWFLNTYNTWLTLRVDGDRQKVSFYTNIFGYFKFGGVLVAPLAGVYMDYRRAPLQGTPSSHAQKAISAVPSLVVTSVTSLLLSASVLIQEETVIYVTLVLAEVYRAFLFATAVALLESVFSPLVYGKLFGVQYTVGAAVNFLMFPLSSWTESTAEGFTHVNTLLLIAVGTTLMFPGQVAFSYIRMKRKEKRNTVAANKI